MPTDIKGWRYKPPAPPSIPLQLGQQLWYEGLHRAESVAHICSKLQKKGWIPDCILAHSGWGETLAISEVFPDTPQIIWPELWMLPIHGGYGSDKLLPPPGLPQKIEQIGRNALTRVALDMASAWVMPTLHQANSLPKAYRTEKLHVIHEGIDTTLASPDPNVEFLVRDIRVNRHLPTITFVNRNLERLRGFDQFMRSLPPLLKKWPTLRVFIVGDSGKGYGCPHPSGRPIRQVILDELKGQLDLSRVHFLGRIPHHQLLALMQVSSVHVYLSYPFVLSWSLLEAMSCECAIVGSQGMPVSEVINHGSEGLLVPWMTIRLCLFSIDKLLADQELRRFLGKNARKKALSFDKKVTLPLFESLIHSVAGQ